MPVPESITSFPGTGAVLVVAVDGVDAVAAGQLVVAGSADELVVGDRPRQLVVAVAASQFGRDVEEDLGVAVTLAVDQGDLVDLLVEVGTVGVGGVADDLAGDAAVLLGHAERGDADRAGAGLGDDERLGRLVETDRVVGRAVAAAAACVLGVAHEAPCPDMEDQVAAVGVGEHGGGKRLAFDLELEEDDLGERLGPPLRPEEQVDLGEHADADAELAVQVEDAQHVAGGADDVGGLSELRACRRRSGLGGRCRW